ncbi:putative polyketide synthase MbtC [Nocardia neocaledoniensis NBRC 108232]|uniref:Mycobactin polyketide synthetase MbtC n=1 Tax=Nocardia neocaledoniensis TaxID=236511 RepID=A0A317NS42_9NOCA|nr:polyketide synthase [Nocardia neocaledoniensis]PWV77772.1 mycobactin polyketide synthetase MbtC [Nocardia neocaledoniensis]GEM31082.1 putative polyketide synthase MbtC [Nocardia neocaledoniensis NBRC 108232]
MTQDTDPIVIVGMGVEAPGGVDTLPAFWSALADGRELIGPFPRGREWPLDELFALGRLDGWAPVRDAGGFLDGATEFDAQFFGITPREAVAMDPQQRVAMRVAWRALEHAGINPGALDGDPAGVWMGVSTVEYGPRVGEVNEYSGYRATGTALGAVAGRISHGLGLIGPSISVDTACASSLTAVHQAAAAVRAGECEWALAGGVCVMGSPGAFYEFSKNNALATDGHCRSYAADPTGTLWGEGAGVVVLERESRAKALGHRIYGQLLGSRVNHNGAGAPIAVPSAAAQQRLIEATVAAAGIDASAIGLIEGHGTGTAVGDPLELTALAATYGAVDRTDTPLLGSVKSNAGHAQAASGMLGLIKVLLCGANGAIAPSLWAEDPTTDIDWDATSLRLAAKLTDWAPRADGLRYAAVSSFGVAGTNAHAIVGLPVLEETNHG